MPDATMRRNKIADDMWTQYQDVLRQRLLQHMEGMADDLEETDLDDDDEGSDDDDNDFYV
jgi:hypothetical protein